MVSNPLFSFYYSSLADITFCDSPHKYDLIIRATLCGEFWFSYSWIATKFVDGFASNTKILPLGTLTSGLSVAGPTAYKIDAETPRVVYLN